MKRIVAGLVALVLAVDPILAALPSGGIWEINAGATASNVNGGGFNIGNANFLTDLTTDTNTGNTSAPVVQSASYNFAAGDVGHWVYVSTGTNWYPGWYQIQSVASNKATLSAVAGSTMAIVVTDLVTGTTIGRYGTKNTTGIASVGTPTGGTFGIDYSQKTTSIINNTDLATADGDGVPLLVTSAGSPFGVNHTGNFIRISAGTGWTTGWYEIVSVSGVTATLDRIIGTNGAKTGGTFRVGGALSFNSTLDDDVSEAFIPGNTAFVRNNGTVTLGESVSVTTGVGLSTRTIQWDGYNTSRGDNPTGSSRPTISCTTLAFTAGARSDGRNLNFTGTGTAILTIPTFATWRNIKVTNSSTSSGRPSISINASGALIDSESIAYRGYALSKGNAASEVIGCYFHDSDVGYRLNSTASASEGLRYSIIENCITAAIDIVNTYTGALTIANCTLYGAENKLGKGIGMVTGAGGALTLLNTIFYGFTTAIVGVDTRAGTSDSLYNTFFNNTNDTTSNDVWQKGASDIAVDPVFTNVTQVTGTGATSSTNVLTDGSKNFTTLGVTTNDHVYLSTGTGTGFASAIFGISSVGTTTLTLTSNITSSGSGSGITYQLTLGHNFVPTASGVKGAGFPGSFQAGYTTGTMDIGGVQAPGGGTNLLGVIQ